VTVARKEKIICKINGSLLTVILTIYTYEYLVKGRAVEQFVEALRYKPEGRGFDWNFSLTLAALWPCGRLSL